MPYYDYLGREIEDAEGDNMRREREENSARRVYTCERCGQAFAWNEEAEQAQAPDYCGTCQAELEAQAEAEAEAAQEEYEQRNQSRTRYALHTEEGGAIAGNCWTNDNLDAGYPSEDASWDVRYSDLAHALKATGGTHQGIGAYVEVWLDGRLIDRQGEAITEDEQGGAIARQIAASVDQAEAEGREGYSICMRCGALFDGEYCPNCD